MDVIALIGRILFVLLFFGSAMGHLTQTEAMAGYAASKNIPSPKLATQASGVVMIVGGLMVLLGVWADLGALLLALFLLPTAFLMHDFWKQTDPQAKQQEMIQFNKDLSLAGAALLFFGIYAGPGSDLGLTITGPLFG
ncbi:putative membrane protein YphA (DoxX/SURF4 family) [Saccharothrix tamanrassetensis]|uniref:Putative membrane protein YphA (DoxX/SURF4 family) n=1 Tax=Saccharothrix tamanrassetensis TaxID=1051531 RepID=A0A841CGS7_9PSEU|nr:DoxX family protein [Saccharothrix tamanrassetensis]MBB5957732.1 putative membrane protein YphA (DoxX/SURF4 family) [Saccharothrix tamanrassetensis]